MKVLLILSLVCLLAGSAFTFEHGSKVAFPPRPDPCLFGSQCFRIHPVQPPDADFVRLSDWRTAALPCYGGVYVDHPALTAECLVSRYTGR